MEESKRDLPHPGVPVPQGQGNRGHPCASPGTWGTCLVTSHSAQEQKVWLPEGEKMSPKFRLSEHFHLSDLICREAFSLPPKAACYRVNSPALYIVLMDLVRQHHQALRPYRNCSCIFKRFNLPFSHINLLFVYSWSYAWCNAHPINAKVTVKMAFMKLFLCTDALFKCYNFKPFSPCFQKGILNKGTRTLGSTDQGFNHNQTRLILRLEKVWFLVCRYLCSFAISCSCSWWAKSEPRSPIFCNTPEGGSTQNCPLLWNFTCWPVRFQQLRQLHFIRAK